MNTISRREFFALVLVGPLASGCAASLSSDVQVGEQLVNDVQGLAHTLAGQFLSIQRLLNSTTAQQVSSWLTTLEGLAGTVSTSLTQNAAAPTISRIIGVVQQIAGVAGVALPPPWGLAIRAASALLPVIASEVGLAFTSRPTAASMSPDQARSILGIVHAS